MAASYIYDHGHYMHIVNMCSYLNIFVYSVHPSEVAEIRSNLWNSFTVQVYS